MSRRNKFELNRAGLRELMSGAEMRSLLLEAGSTVVRNAGEGFALRIWDGPLVPVCYVDPIDDAAWEATLKDNALVKALGASSLPM